MKRGRLKRAEAGDNVSRSADTTSSVKALVVRDEGEEKAGRGGVDQGVACGGRGDRCNMSTAPGLGTVKVVTGAIDCGTSCVFAAVLPLASSWTHAGEGAGAAASGG